MKMFFIWQQVRVQSDPAGRLVISGQPEQQDNPWGVTSFKKVMHITENPCFACLMNLTAVYLKSVILTLLSVCCMWWMVLSESSNLYSLYLIPPVCVSVLMDQGLLYDHSWNSQFSACCQDWDLVWLVASKAFLCSLRVIFAAIRNL